MSAAEQMYEHQVFSAQFKTPMDRKALTVAMNQLTLQGGWEVFQVEHCPLSNGRRFFLWSKRALHKDGRGNIAPSPGEGFHEAYNSLVKALNRKRAGDESGPRIIIPEPNRRYDP